MSDIKIIKTNGGLLRDSESLDQVTALVFYTNAALDAKMNGKRTHRIFSVEQAEDLGVLETGAFDVLHYHISEYFRINSSGDLFVYIANKPTGTHTFSEVTDLQMEVEGEIRQLGVFTEAVYSDSLVQALHDVALKLDEDEDMPLSTFLAADMSDITDITSVTNARGLNSHKVTPVAAQSGSGQGKKLFDTKGYSITCLGAALGAASRANVAMNIGEVGRQPLVTGEELAIAAYANGQLVSKLTKTAQKLVASKGYLVLRKYVGDTAQTYFYDAPTATLATSDYAYVENVRTIDKAARLVRLALLPTLNGGVKVDRTTGNLDGTFVEYYKSLVNRPLQQMQNEESISGYGVTLDPNQKVLQTGTLQLTIKLVPIGIGRNIEVKLGYTTKISQ